MATVDSGGQKDSVQYRLKVSLETALRIRDVLHKEFGALPSKPSPDDTRVETKLILEDLKGKAICVQDTLLEIETLIRERIINLLR